MKQIILATTIIIFWTSASAQQTDCNNFKTGKFQNIENGVVKTEIRRTKNFQFEEEGEVKIKLKIEWINNCSYQLIFVEGNDAWWQSHGKNRSTPDLFVTITNINGNSYQQECKFKDNDFIYRSTIVKVK